jgi:hypothetical protein
VFWWPVGRNKSSLPNLGSPAFLLGLGIWEPGALGSGELSCKCDGLAPLSTCVMHEAGTAPQGPSPSSPSPEVERWCRDPN